MPDPINPNYYHSYLVRFIKQAIANSDGSNYGISLHLSEIQIRKWFVPHKLEQVRALSDARQAFDNHRHWPRNIILSHLGITLEEIS